VIDTTDTEVPMSTFSVSRRGATIFEILLALGITGSMAAMILPAHAELDQVVQVASMQRDLMNLGLSMELAYMETGDYPATQEEADYEPTAGVTLFIDLVSGGYVATASHAEVAATCTLAVVPGRNARVACEATQPDEVGEAASVD
jgi:Tfp pilus assembly protein PilE